MAWLRKIAAMAACFVIAFILAGAPVDIVNAFKPPPGGGTAHVFLLGFAEPFYTNIGFREDYYSILRDYVDESVYGMVSLYAQLGKPIPFLSAEYEPNSTALFLELLRTAPNDVYMRFFGAASLIGGYPINHLIYGPILLIILAIGAITFWRSIVFYLLSAGSLVAMLTLQVGGRHAFYFVILGAVAIGLAASIFIEAIYLLTRMRSGARFEEIPVWSGVKRRAPIAAFVAGGVVAVGVGFAWALDRMQTQALTARLLAYEQMDWRSIPFSATDSEISFDFDDVPPLASGPWRGADNNVRPQAPYGYTAVRFAFPGVGAAPNTLRPAEWEPIDGVQLTARGNGFDVTSNGQRGYQLLSRAIDIAELTPAPGDRTRQLDVTVSGVVNGSGWGVGAQTHDGSAWLSFVTFPPGPIQTRLRFDIPSTEASTRLVFESSSATPMTLHLTEFLPRSGFDRSCAQSLVTLRQLYDHPIARRLHPQSVGETSEFVYYFPFYNNPEMQVGWRFRALEIQGAWAGCATDVAVAVPAGRSLPIEIVAPSNPDLVTYRRAEWSAIWSDFWRWSRPEGG